jgi:regulator of protease activity HflC (stomatin/prohibitin superfamily)
VESGVDEHEASRDVAPRQNGVGGSWTILLGTLLFLILASGFTVVAPNEARVVLFFGRYVGTVRTAGFHWTVPLTRKRRISLRVRNFESSRLKVSDFDGNPVEVAAVVVWRVVDSAKAAFAVDDHITYVAVQSEAAVRHMASSHPYDAHEQGQTRDRAGDAGPPASQRDRRGPVQDRRRRRGHGAERPATTP